MSSTDQQPSHESSVPRPFSKGVTFLCTVLLALLGLFVLFLTAEGPRLDMFEQPMTLAARYFDRELEMSDASPDASAWNRRLQRFVFSSRADVLDEAIRELDSTLQAHANGEFSATPAEALRVEGRLVLVLAEADRRDALRTRLDTLAARGAEGAGLAALVRFAYGLSDEPPATPEALEAALVPLRAEAHPGPTWATDRLTSRVLRRLGDEPGAREAEERLLDRGARTLTRAVWLSGSIVAFVLAGLALGATRLRLRPPLLPRLSSGVSSAPWSAAEGYDMTVRSAIFGLGVVVLYLIFLDLLLSDSSQPFVTLIGALPLLHYLTRRVPAVHGTGLVELFGLRLEAPATALLVTSLLLIAIEQAFGMGTNLLSQTRWYEGVVEDVVLGGPTEVVLFFIDAVILAPVFEEIACRGLLYTSLRTRFGPWTSAMVSAALFTLPHMYSPLVALGLFLGAVASAIVYERTRSLLPCIIAHAVNNALALGALLVYR